MTPLLTIITVTYQAELYIERTLKSIQNALELIEDKSQVEYLIIDGGSKDATLKIAQQYASFITKIISEPDHGLYDAMNKGLTLATGQYLWFLNAGDEAFNRETLHVLLSQLQSQSDVIYSDAMFVKNDGRELGLRSRITPHKLPQNLKWQNFSLGMKVCHQAFIVKKSIAPNYDIDNLSADIDWEIICLKKAKSIRYLSTPLCRYLIGGLSIQNHRKSLMDRYAILNKHFGLVSNFFNHVIIFGRSLFFKIKRA